MGASGGDGVVEEAAAVTAVPGTAIPSTVAGAAVAVGESSLRSKSCKIKVKGQVKVLVSVKCCPLGFR